MVNVDNIKVENAMRALGELNNRELALVVDESMRKVAMRHGNKVKAKAAHVYMRTVHGCNYELKQLKESYETSYD